eukprot:CCRYP_020650-RA/>CCRYP_020650-RA protein AED:0.36 eAED:0.36 QI:607/1/1/1/0/0.5/2/146/433
MSSSSSSKRSSDDPSATATKKSKTTSANLNRYSGWTVPSQHYEIPAIDVHNVTPEQFYKDYIQPRRPVVIKGLPDDLSNLSSWNNLPHLDKAAGHQTVMVERRSDTADGYGQGNEVSMTFSHFLKLLQNGDEMHYLTTQDVPSNADGRPDILPPLMKALSHDFPLRPRLMGKLIPQNMNLWMGNANARIGSSSGLHHDYHDNLYVVLAGRKRFRLFSPRDAEYLYTRGRLLSVHPNGRINYVGEETTAHGADLGAYAAAVAATRQRKAEERLYEAERGVEEGRAGAMEELEEAEEELERAMEALIDAEVDEDDDEEEEAEEDEACDGVNGCRLVDKTVKNPNNFSKVPVEMLEDVTKFQQEYPDLQKTTMAYCDINPGEMLYLPASWFHEVTSYSGEKGAHHIALNYCLCILHIIHHQVSSSGWKGFQFSIRK